ncbi:MAG TPA: hypothetical protein V6C71_13070 [Coleofasciculaceae cyanobacterium]|jgi:hypothetical protein
MLTTKKTTMSLGAIALGIIAASLFILPLNAQTDTSEEIFLEDIKVGEDMNWSFSSEDETNSVQNRFNDLGEYSISDSTDDANVQLLEENRRWGNRGDATNYLLEAEIYNY